MLSVVMLGLTQSHGEFRRLMETCLKASILNFLSSKFKFIPDSKKLALAELKVGSCCLDYLLVSCLVLLCGVGLFPIT